MGRSKRAASMKAKKSKTEEPETNSGESDVSLNVERVKNILSEAQSLIAENKAQEEALDASGEADAQEVEAVVAEPEGSPEEVVVAEEAVTESAKASDDDSGEETLGEIADAEEELEAAANIASEALADDISYDEIKAQADNGGDEGEFSNLPPVLIVSSESAPLAKVGGLADVVGALPKYLRKFGVDARIIMPFHKQIKERYASEATHLFSYFVGEQWTDRFVGIDKMEIDGTIYYFVDSEYYFGGPIYRGGNFEGEQYTFFMQVVCDVIPNLDFNPGIIHCNDWQSALVPFKLKAKAKRLGIAPRKMLLTIHNLAFQGTFGDDTDVRVIGDDEHNYAWDLGCWNMMKAGIDTADRVNTVSPTYAWQITTPEFGEGLQDDLRYLADDGRLSGILNGIDTDEWNPATDKAIAATYDLRKMSGKLKCKKALMKELGLEFDKDAPLIAMVGRLTHQKGIDIACDVMEDLVNQGVRFCVLGSGDPGLEARLRDLERRHKGRICSYIGYNGDLSHRFYAASDFFFMPSAFEPCGISQMIAMRYGSLPIVHETGGLKDTVIPYNHFTGEGCGFSFLRMDFWDAVEACKRALGVWENKDIMSRLIENAMQMDFGFDRCAHSYAELYQSMM